MSSVQPGRYLPIPHDSELRDKVESRTLAGTGRRDCHLWQGSVKGHGYGRVYYRGRSYLVHRATYTWAKGPIPDGMPLDHLCRNTSCVNPDHLEAVTHRENCMRGNAPAAKQAQRTHCSRGHKLSPGNLIPSSLRAGRRSCLKCSRIRGRKQIRRRKEARCQG